MKNKIIESILEAEKETEDIYSKAKLESTQIISTAEEQNTNIKNSAQETSKKMLKGQLEENENKCKQQFEETLGDYNAQAKALEQNAEKNYKKAVDVILKKLEKLN